MRGFDLRVSIRLQLLALFGLLLITGASVLVIDEVSQYRTRLALGELKDESLAGLRRIMAISDAYSADIVDTVFKVRNGLMGWEQASNVVDVYVRYLRRKLGADRFVTLRGMGYRLDALP